jgi:hydroxyethylthiazole kinase-like uncharacterized protein yjeF
MPVPVISVAQMRVWEKASWAAGCSESEVIARVGRIVAKRAARMTRAGDLVLVLAGKGHNGDDARRAAENLSGCRVQLLEVTEPGGDLAALVSALEQKPRLIIDGLFGIGLDRPLDEHWIKFINQVNDANGTVLAIDVPSGLNAETGQPEGAAIRAAITLTLGAPKHGLLAQSAWEFVGRLEVAPDIGLVPCPHTSELMWTLPEDFLDFPPPRSSAGHKGDFGRLAIVAGSLGFHGAAVLAARGSQRAQPGLITLYALEAVYHVIAPQLQAVMVSIWPPTQKLPWNFTSILVGPGLAAENIPDELQMATRHVWRDSQGPVIIDASALDWLPIAHIARTPIRVITPHPGEAARLLRTSVQQVQSNRVATLREISRRLGNCWVVLKGQQTLIGRDVGTIYVNSSGNAHLAQGGSGDVLAGYLAGLLAQPHLQANPAKTISYGVWQHGATADRLTEARRNWVVEDLVENIGIAEAGGEDGAGARE